MSLLRSFVLLGSGVIAGGIVGAYVTTLVYGSRVEPVAPRVTPPKAACPACPICPTSTSTEAIRSVIPALDPDQPPPEVEVPEVARPGLPSSAVRIASLAFQRELAPCLSAEPAGEGERSLVLSLTVTATGGIGHLREVEVIRREGEVASLEACAMEVAKKVQFEWRSVDGESKVVLPLKVGAH